MAQIEANQQNTKVLLYSYCCPNCDSSHCLTIQRLRMDNNVRSILLWYCSNCGFKWKEIWSSYSKPIWSLQHHSMQRPKVMIHKIC